MNSKYHYHNIIICNIIIIETYTIARERVCIYYNNIIRVLTNISLIIRRTNTNNYTNTFLLYPYIIVRTIEFLKETVTTTRLTFMIFGLKKKNVQLCLYNILYLIWFSVYITHANTNIQKRIFYLDVNILVIIYNKWPVIYNVDNNFLISNFNIWELFNFFF